MRLTAGPLPFRNRLLLVFAVPLGIWVLVSIASVITLHNAMEHYHFARRSQLIIQYANEYRNSASELRNEERIYLRSPSPEVLQNRRRILQRSNQLHVLMSNLMRDDAVQMEQLDIAGDRLQKWYYDVSEQRIREHGVTGESVTVEELLHEGPELIREFLRAISQVISAEQAKLEMHRHAIDDDIDWIHWIIWSGLVLGILSMVTVTILIARQIGRSVRNINVATEELARGNLGARVETTGKGDELAERFNAMADLVEKRNTELTVLADLGEMLNTCTSMEEATRVFDDYGQKLFPDKPGALYLVEPNKTDVRTVATWPDPASEQELHFEDCWALRLGRTHVSHSGTGSRCAHLATDQNSARCVPLPAFGEIIGALSVQELDDVPLNHRKHFVEMVAQQIALAFANVRLRELLKQQAIRDPLTQLFNRRHLDESFMLEIYRAERHSQPLSVLLFDIDHFKRVNDVHGHDAGDAILKCIGETLQDYFRPEDTAFRTGGEEFVVLLPGMHTEDARQRAEEFRNDVARLSIVHGDIRLPGITISIGVAAYPVNGTTYEQVMKAADIAMYRAKQSGRNRVVIAPSSESNAH